MPTIQEVKNRKLKLQKTIFAAIKDFEKDGVTIDYISIERDWEREEEIMQRPVPDSEPIGPKNGGIIGVKSDLKIDLD